MPVVLLSGGLDSTTLLVAAQQRTDKEKIIAFSVDYGQRHKCELQAACMIAAHLRVEHRVFYAEHLNEFLTGSALTDSHIEVPAGEYTKESLKTTVVPNRNMVLISIAAGVAIANNLGSIVYAAHTADHEIYADCRPDFIAALDTALFLGTDQKVHLIAPFSGIDKAEIVRIGSQFNAPFELSYSCYKGEKKHCGECSTCHERKRAFQEANVIDPTEYKK